MAGHLLILGGTREARELAQAAAAAFPDLTITYSLAGRTRQPIIPSAVSVRIGGFGGVDGLRGFLVAERITAVVDATHPFADRISENAARACNQAGVPRLVLRRPPWQPQESDQWTAVACEAEAAAALPSGARVCLALGRQHLAPFAARRDVWFLLRLMDETVELPPFAQAERVSIRDGLSEGAERTLLENHAITHLVTRNSGGDWGYGKLAAASRLGLAVSLIAQPAPAGGPIAATVHDALCWCGSLPLRRGTVARKTGPKEGRSND